MAPESNESASGNDAGVPSQGQTNTMMGASNSSALTEEEAVSAHLKARLLTKTDPAALSQNQVDLLYHEDLLCTKTLTLSIIGGKNFGAIDEKLGVIKLLSDALEVMEAADSNSDARISSSVLATRLATRLAARLAARDRRSCADPSWRGL